MGSSVLRSNREIKSDGSTNFKFNLPVLTIGGTKDGLFRITRVAESYFHGSMNVNINQKDMFPVVAVEGLSHA